MPKESGLIRPCRWYELPRVIEIFKDCGVHYEVCDYESGLRQKLEHDPESVLVLEYQKRIVGAVLLVYDPWTSFIFHLAVDPDHRRRGFGNALLEAAENRLRLRGTGNIAAYILPGNRVSLDMVRKRSFVTFPLRVVCVDKPLAKPGATF